MLLHISSETQKKRHYCQYFHNLYLSEIQNQINLESSWYTGRTQSAYSLKPDYFSVCSVVLNIYYACKLYAIKV